MISAMAPRTGIKSVTVLKVVKPNHFLIKEFPGLCMSRSAQMFLELESEFLNQFDLIDVIPQVFEFPMKGSIVLVKPEDEEVWYRGKVVTVLETSKGARISTFLVDYGKVVAVGKEWVRNIPAEYMDVPFQALDFILPNIQPSSLIYNELLILHRGPSGKWDTSAIEDVKKVVQIERTGEVLIEHQDSEGVCYGQLFVDNFGDTIHVNKYLLEMHFACHLALYHINDKKTKMLTDQLFIWDDSDVYSRSPSRIGSSISGRTSTASRGRGIPVVRQSPSLPKMPENSSFRRRLSCSSSSTLSMTFSSQESESTVTGKPSHKLLNRVCEQELKVPSSDLNFQLLNATRPESGLFKVQSEVSPIVSPSQAFSTTSSSLHITTTPFSHHRLNNRSHSVNESDSRSISSSICSSTGKGRGQKLVDIILKMKENSPYRLGSCVSAVNRKENDNSDEKRSSKVLHGNSNGGSDFGSDIEIRETSLKSLKYLVSETSVESETFGTSTPLQRKCSFDTTLTSRKQSDESASTSTPVQIQRTPQNSAKSAEQFFGARPKSKNNFYQSLPKYITPSIKPVSTSLKQTKSPVRIQKTGSSLSSSNVLKTPQKTVSHSASTEHKKITNPPLSNKRNEFSSSVNFQPASSNYRLKNKSIFNPLSKHKLSHLVLGDPISKILCFGSFIPRPVDTLNSASLAEPIKDCLNELCFPAPSTIQSHVWPAVLRGRSVVAISPMHSGKSLAFIVPLLSLLLQHEDYEKIKERSGPLVLVLSSSWHGCQELYSQCLLLVPEFFHTKIECIYSGSGIKNQEFSVAGGCDLLITTPACYLHMNKIIEMDRCCHIMLDDADVLIECFLDEVRDIMIDYDNQLKKRPFSSSLPSQVLLSSSRCTPGIQSFIRKMMHEPIVFISSFMEAAIYARMPIFPVVSSKIQLANTVAELLLSGEKRRTVLCTTTAEVAELITPVLHTYSIHTLTIHEHLEHFKMKALQSEWDDAACTAVLVVSDYVLPELDLTTAEWLIHYDMPEISRLIFGYRFRCLMKNLQSKTEYDKNPSNQVPTTLFCHIMLTEDCLKQSVDIIRFFNRMKVECPKKLQELGMQKQHCKELCSNLKTFGSCRLQSWCNFRHNFSKLDQPSMKIPHFGEVTIHISHILDASHFYGQLVEYSLSRNISDVVDLCNAPTLRRRTNLVLKLWNDYQEKYYKDPSSGNLVNTRQTYLDLHVQLTLHYSKSCNKSVHLNAAVGDICGVAKSGGTYFRVQERKKKIIEIGDIQSQFDDLVQALHIPENPVLLKKASVFFLDEGYMELVELNLLLILPEKLFSVPPQALEVYACRVQPVDGHQQWTPQASSRVHDHIMDKNVSGKVVMCLKNSLFLDPIVIRTQVLKSTYMHTFNLSLVLLKEGFAIPNPEHVTKLKEACNHIFTWQESLMELQGCVQNGHLSPEIGVTSGQQPTVNDDEIPNICPSPEKNPILNQSSCKKFLNQAEVDIGNDQSVKHENKVKTNNASQNTTTDNLILHEHNYESLDTKKTHTVYISAAFTPHLFYVQLVQSYDEMVKQNDQINHLVRNYELEELKQPEIGTVCVALFDDGMDNWFRAKVKNIYLVEEKNEPLQDEFELFFLDFGDTCRAKRCQLFEITPELLELPFQAVECSLMGIQAVTEGWADDISQTILDMTRDEDNIYKEFLLRVVEQSPASGRIKKIHYSVQVWQPQVESLASQLVNLGLAMKVIKRNVPQNLTSENEADCESSVLSLTPEPDCEEKKAFYSLMMHKLIGEDTKALTETSDEESTRVHSEKPHRKPREGNIAVPEESAKMNINQPLMNKICKSTTTVQSKIKELHSVVDKDMPNLEVVHNFINSRLPKVQWYQTQNEVFVIVLVSCCQEFDFFATSSLINLSLLQGDNFYSMKEVLYDQVVVEKSESVPHEMNIRMKLIKKVAKKWPRLIKSDKKAKHITVHHDHLDTTSCDETATEERTSANADSTIKWKTLNYDPCNMDDKSGDETDMTWTEDNSNRYKFFN